MLRTLAAMAAVGMLLSAFDASAAPKGGPPYKLDAKGMCHDSSGALTAKSNCPAPNPAAVKPASVVAAKPGPTKGGPPYKLDAQGSCHDSSGQLTAKTNCATPAAVKAPGAKPRCTNGKPCGNACIKLTAVCHVPG